MRISSTGIALIKEFEGFPYNGYRYRDAVGVLTIGYGTTEADINPLPEHLTEREASALLERQIDQKYAPSVNGLGVPLNQNQFDALVSFAYNLGPGIFIGSAIGRYLRERNYWAAADAMLQYDHAGGAVLAGLARRREAERALFLRPVSPLAVLTPDERRLVTRLDDLRRHRTRNARQIARVRKALIAQRKLIWQAGHESGWNHRNRRARYELLLERTSN